MPDIDHRTMTPPFLRVMHESRCVQVWDLRIAQPNVSVVSSAVMHSLEHFLNTTLKAASDSVVNVGLMGCQTGFYIVTSGIASFADLAALLTVALRRIEEATEVPLANDVQCGWAENHSLAGSKSVAAWLLSRRADWDVVAIDASRSEPAPGYVIAIDRRDL